MKKKGILGVLEILFGIVLLYIAIKVFDGEDLKSISGLGYGLGSVLLVFGIMHIIMFFTVTEEKEEELKRGKKVAVEDERNKFIIMKSKSITSEIMTYIFCLVILIMGLLQVDKLIIIIASIVLVVKFVLIIVFTNYYSNKI